MSGLKFRRLDSIGAEVSGADWTQPIADDVARDLYAAWLEHGVLVFPRAGLDADVHLRLSRVFGELEEHPVKSLHVKGRKDLIFFGGDETKGPGKMVDGEKLAGYLYAHQDMAYTPNLCKGSMLRMVIMPDRGGDTLFWDTARAWRDLPAATRERLRGLHSIHRMNVIPPRNPWGMPGHTVEALETEAELIARRGYAADIPLIRHPMTITHPESGLVSLLLSPNSYVVIEGMAQAESDAFFDELTTHLFQPQYGYRHCWSLNDIVLWDNRRTVHMATGYPHEQTRLAYRTTLKGAMACGEYYKPADRKVAATT